MFLQVRAGDSGEELALEQVEAGSGLDAEAAAVEAGVEVAAEEEDSAAGGNGRELPPSQFIGCS